MAEARIEPGVRIGSFLLEDILRSMDPQWALSNTARFEQMTEPLLAEIMACLHHVGGIQLLTLEQENRIAIHYVRFGQRLELPGLDNGLVRAGLTRQEALNLIDETCLLAEKHNPDVY